MTASREMSGQDFQVSFREAMSRFPSGVTIVTAVEAGIPWGFTASSFCSVSLDPPLVLVCLARTATCHNVFSRAERFAVNILTPRHGDLARRFAVRGADKFGGGEFVDDPWGLPVLEDAHVRLLCTTWSRHEAGDHVILVGRVVDLALGEGPDPLIHLGRGFRNLR